LSENRPEQAQSRAGIRDSSQLEGIIRTRHSTLRSRLSGLEEIEKEKAERLEQIPHSQGDGEDDIRCGQNAGAKAVFIANYEGCCSSTPQHMIPPPHATSSFKRDWSSILWMTWRSSPPGWNEIVNRFL
jgi:hypothetical protein